MLNKELLLSGALSTYPDVPYFAGIFLGDWNISFYIQEPKTGTTIVNSYDIWDSIEKDSNGKVGFSTYSTPPEGYPDPIVYVNNLIVFKTACEAKNFNIFKDPFKLVIDVDSWDCYLDVSEGDTGVGLRPVAENIQATLEPCRWLDALNEDVDTTRVNLNIVVTDVVCTPN